MSTYDRSHELERICVECGNDLACYGYALCSDCLDLYSHNGWDVT